MWKKRAGTYGLGITDRQTPFCVMQCVVIDRGLPLFHPFAALTSSLCSARHYYYFCLKRFHRSWTSAASESKPTPAFLGSLNIGIRLMNWTRCEVLNFIGWKKVMNKFSSRGTSNRTERSPKYSLTPLNQKSARLGKIDRVIRGGRRLSLSGRDREKWKSRKSVLRLANTERQEIIASGEKYPEWGIS